MSIAMAPKPIPEGFSTITPYIIVRNASDAIEFYKKAFDAKELSKNTGPDGKMIIHALITIGNSKIMISDEFPDMQCLSPESIGGNASELHMYVEDADKTFNQAISAGAKVTMPLEDTFWGDRYGKIKDPYGHTWSIATHIKDISHEEIQNASDKIFSEMDAGIKK